MSTWTLLLGGDILGHNAVDGVTETVEADTVEMNHGWLWFRDRHGLVKVIHSNYVLAATRTAEATEAE